MSTSTARRRTNRPTRTPVCVCGARLRWVQYVPADVDPYAPGVQLSWLPLDLVRLDAPRKAWRTANYVVTWGAPRARRVTPDSPLDPRREQGHFNVHYATCPQRVTPEQLAELSQQNGRAR